MTRFVPVTVLVLLAAIRVANAEGMIGTSGAEIQFQHLKVTKDGTTLFEPELTKRPLYFNLAHCTCSKAGKDKFTYEIHETQQSGIHSQLEFWVGSQCADDTLRNMMCKQVSTIQDVDKLFTTPEDHDFSLFDVVNGKVNQDQDCLTTLEGTATIWAFVSNTGSTTSFEYKTTINVGTLTGETASSTNGVDTKPPPLPTGLTASGSENSIALSWTPSTANSTDVDRYQALCANLDGTPARSQATDPLYITTTSICPDVTPPAAEKLTEQTLDNGEDPVPMPTDAFGALDPRYICGEESGTAESMTIDGLQNGTAYQVILLAVDLHGNFTGTYFSSTITPHAVTDFWEDLHDRGSKVEGGLCLLAETYGDDSGLTNALRAFRDDTLSDSWLGRWARNAYYATAAKLGTYVHSSIALRLLAVVLLSPFVVFALLWHWLTLPGVLTLLAASWWCWRRRGYAPRWATWMFRKWPLRIAAALGWIVLGVNPAHAGGGYQPYWEDTDPSNNQDRSLADQAGLIKWHAGIRLGPYVPDIDKQFGMSPGPYEQMFGGFHVLPMLDVDRILWTGYGQVGVGVSLGYMSKNARAFVLGSDPADPERPRDRAARNTFRLVPFALTGTYRFTALDDDYGIPVVPYIRAGLAYYLWWIKAPGGGLASVCKDPTAEMCSKNKALGASLGVTGSIGLAIRAERIDASTAMSMQQSGIQHAGIYAELSIAKVDGFGSDSKLSVGDKTWFAGVDFEF